MPCQPAACSTASSSALVPDEAGEGVPVLTGEVDALDAAVVELLGVFEPLGAGSGRAVDPGVGEEVLVVDDDAVGRVPGNAVLRAVDAAGIGETGQPVLVAEVPYRFEGEVVQGVALGVLGDLGVAHLDDVRRSSCSSARR